MKICRNGLLIGLLLVGRFLCESTEDTTNAILNVGKQVPLPNPVGDGLSALRVDSTNKPPIDLPYCAFSKPSSNIVAVFEGPRRDAPVFPSDAQIAVGFHSVTNSKFEIFRLDRKYAFRLVAKSETGESISLTRLGEKYGSKFNETCSFDQRQLDWSGEYYQAFYSGVKSCNRGARPFWGIADFDNFPRMLILLPTPNELFKFNKPGKYLLTIEMQCYSRPFPPISTNVYLVRFPPTTLQVIRGGAD